MWVNNIILWKITIFSTRTNLIRRMAPFYMFANLRNVWLHRRQLDSHIWFGIQSVAISHIMQLFKNSNIYLWKNENENSKYCLRFIIKMVLTFQTPERVLPMRWRQKVSYSVTEPGVEPRWSDSGPKVAPPSQEESSRGPFHEVLRSTTVSNSIFQFVQSRGKEKGE